MDYSAGFMGIVPSSEVLVRKREALEEYISQLEQRIGVTDPEKLPRYYNRLNYELTCTKIELNMLTES